MSTSEVVVDLAALSANARSLRESILDLDETHRRIAGEGCDGLAGAVGSLLRGWSSLTGDWADSIEQTITAYQRADQQFAAALRVMGPR